MRFKACNRDGFDLCHFLAGYWTLWIYRYQWKLSVCLQLPFFQLLLLGRHTFWQRFFLLLDQSMDLFHSWFFSLANRTRVRCSVGICFSIMTTCIGSQRRRCWIDRCSSFGHGIFIMHIFVHLQHFKLWTVVPCILFLQIFYWSFYLSIYQV